MAETNDWLVLMQFYVQAITTANLTHIQFYIVHSFESTPWLPTNNYWEKITAAAVRLSGSRIHYREGNVSPVNYLMQKAYLSAVENSASGK